MVIKYMLDEGGFAPEKAHRADAGFDIKSPVKVIVPEHGSAIIDTRLRVGIPVGYVGMIKSKSGLNVKQGLRAEGVIDAGYIGTIVVKMYNDSDKPYTFNIGDKLTQLVILPIPDVDMVGTNSLETSDRGENGFGSSGK